MRTDTSILLLFLVGIFGIASWVNLNGLWIEMPLLVNRLPEGWKLPTYTSVLVQLANIGPLIYMCIYHYGKFQHLERFTIYFTLSIGCISCGLLSIFWDYKLDLWLFGERRSTSVALFILAYFLSILDTTSSVTFLPYLVNYPSHYITALYVGEGFSGLIPGCVGLLQGIGGEPYCINKTTENNGTNHTEASMYYPSPKFTISNFFIFLCILLIICIISFLVIDNVKYFQKFKTEKSSAEYEKLAETTFETEEDREEFDAMGMDLLVKKPNRKSKARWIIYVVLVGYISFLVTGIGPSIQSYSLMPYSTALYHNVITVSQILNPLTCLMTIRKWKTNGLTFAILTTIGTIGMAYAIFLAYNSPVAILNNTIFGEILAALSWFTVAVVFTFEKTLLAILLQSEGHIWLQFHGISVQLGSAMGTFLSFFLIAYLNVFESKNTIC